MIWIIWVFNFTFFTKKKIKQSKLHNIFCKKSTYNSLDDPFPFLFEPVSILMYHPICLCLKNQFLFLPRKVLFLPQHTRIITTGLFEFWNFTSITHVSAFIFIVILFLIVHVVLVAFWLGIFAAVTQLKVLVKFWPYFSFYSSQHLNYTKITSHSYNACFLSSVM